MVINYLNDIANKLQKKNSTEPIPTTGNIQGTVTSPTGDTLIVGAIITTSPPTSSVTTGADGGFKIPDVHPDTYTVTANKNGYKPGNATISVNAGKTVTANIQLNVILSNRPPSEPIYIYPLQNSSEEDFSINFKWNACTDPDGDEVLYDFYFGTNNPPNLDTFGIKSTNISKTDLAFGEHYYWKVVAKDNNGATTEGEIWNFKTALLPLNPIAYYPFNGNANDETGNGTNGIVHGATLTLDRFGNANKAYNFNGVNNYVDLGNREMLNLGALGSSYSVAVWIKTKGNVGQYQDNIIGKASNIINLPDPLNLLLGI